ncbi:MAG: hypothetical protein JW910_14935 [Anaerolineae bacterium]|nr:hypothetical protein [Anaerolineae bacterium]
MQITFLGTGGGYGIPNPFCRCANCEAARAAGGKSVRNSPAVLVNDDLLIDCGRDVYPAVHALGLRLDALRTLIITHRHSDHLDPWFFWGRRSTVDTELPPLTVYAPQDVLDEVYAFYARTVGWDPAALAANTHTLWRPVAAGMLKIAGRYRLSFFPATHGQGQIEAVLVGVQDAGVGYLHGYDTGPLSDAAWMQLARHRFNVAALDACIHTQQDYHTSEHMTAAQTISHAGRLREAGILKPGGLALATHFVHQAAGDHADLVAYYAPHDVMPAYDGLVLAVGPDTLAIDA